MECSRVGEIQSHMPDSSRYLVSSSSFSQFLYLVSPIFIFIQVWKAQLALKIRESKELKDQIEKQEKVKNHRQQFQNTGHRWRKLLFLLY